LRKQRGQPSNNATRNLSVPKESNMKTRSGSSILVTTLLALGLLICMLGLGVPAKAQGAKIITFDVPGSVCKASFPECTVVNAINPEGVVVGSYADANAAIHAYLRAADGTFTKFDVPGSQCPSFFSFCTVAVAIDPLGAITGFF